MKLTHRQMISNDGNVPKGSRDLAQKDNPWSRLWDIFQILERSTAPLPVPEIIPAVFPNIEAGKNGWALGCRRDMKRHLSLFTGWKMWKHSNCTRWFQGCKRLGARSFQNPQAFCQFNLPTPQSMFHQWIINGYPAAIQTEHWTSVNIAMLKAKL